VGHLNGILGLPELIGKVKVLSILLRGPCRVFPVAYLRFISISHPTHSDRSLTSPRCHLLLLLHRGKVARLPLGLRLKISPS
jgi:hypothetical protein